jgi:hypothetical protein
MRYRISHHHTRGKIIDHNILFNFPRTGATVSSSKSNTNSSLAPIHNMAKALDNTNNSVFVIAKNGDEQRIEFDEKTTLADFKHQVMAILFGVKEETLFANQVPSQLKLFWCGVEIKEGASWHVGIIDDEDKALMKDLSPGLQHGQPAIHADLHGVVPESE